MDLVVNTDSGPIEGREKDGVFLFAAIPYAAPPTGENRFMPPRAPTPWTRCAIGKEILEGRASATGHRHD
ncbi:MAG: carboxylesterase family protein [Gammaproteobacteria bacterium]|nr:carboxylesterase family protein [Gammaproteobacteria bacterium]